jgi:hypothetical protein
VPPSAVRADQQKILLLFKSKSRINEEGKCDVRLFSSATDIGIAD